MFVAVTDTVVISLSHQASELNDSPKCVNEQSRRVPIAENFNKKEEEFAEI